MDMSTQDYVVVEKKRSTVAFLLLVLVVMNAVSIVISLTTVSMAVNRISELENTIDKLDFSVRYLSRTVSDLDKSYRPISAVMDIYVRYMSAKIIADVLQIPVEEALKIVTRSIEGGNQTSTNLNYTYTR